MIKKKFVFLVILLTFIAIIIYIFRPIPFDKEFFNTDKISVSYFINSKKDGTIVPDAKILTFDRNSAKFDQIEKIFEKYSYHKCFKTWNNNATLEDIGESYQILTDKRKLLITEDSYIEIDFNIYRIGYLGSSKAKKLVTQLKYILEN